MNENTEDLLLFFTSILLLFFVVPYHVFHSIKERLSRKKEEAENG